MSNWILLGEKKQKMKGKLFLDIWFSKSTLNLEMFYTVGSLFRKKQYNFYVLDGGIDG